MFGWLPIIGPVIDGITSVIKGFQNQKVQEGAQDVQVIQARAAVAIAFKDDIGSRLARDLIMFPVSIWVFFTLWDSIFRNVIPHWTFRTLALPTNMEYIPYAVIAFLFVTAFKK